MTHSRILILTASFGDGHNSAARQLAEALDGSSEVKVADPCSLGSPRVNAFLNKAYREVITYAPSLWKRIYDSTDQQDFSKRLFFLNNTEKAVGALLEQFRPDLVVSTYPIYPYQLERHFENHPRVPIVTIVTDSMEVNAAWTRSPSDYFLVTDLSTKNALIEKDIPGEKVVVSGFPVSPRFETIPKVEPDAPTNPFRVLYFPTSRYPHVRKLMRAVLDLPGLNAEVTVVLGRNVRRLYKKTTELRDAYPGRVRLRGWTTQVPELLCSHHLVVGKAGGATVHEAIAARCPMLVHHLVPGQEEGNIQLLEKLKIGALATKPEQITTALVELLADNAKLWRQQKRNLEVHSRPAASAEAAKFVMSLIRKSQESVS